jgi:catechol 2,3-dioxygenase-like lactoylglutathione lyase family enzyme
LIPAPSNSISGQGLQRKCEPENGSTKRQPTGTTTTRGDCAMQDMSVVEIKAFVPSKDFALSKRFYQDFGFNLGWSSDQLAYLHHGSSSFLLQNFYMREHADNFMMHLLVENVEAWWRHVQDIGLAAKYGVKVDPPEDRPWGIRDFVVVDPTGVLWRIGQTVTDAHQGSAG